MNSFRRQTIYNTTVYLGRILVYGVPYLFYSVKRKLLGGNGEPSRVWRNSKTYSYRVREQIRLRKRIVCGLHKEIKSLEELL